MSNFFSHYPEFIDTDVRTARPNSGSGYTISYEYQHHRHSVVLPPELVNGKRVLDLGCCVGATGAWVLAHGATKYVGVEIQQQFCNLAKNNLTKYFHPDQWQIYQQSLDEFVTSSTESFDIIVAFGIIYHSVDIVKTIDQMLSVNPTIIVIDASWPDIIAKSRELKKEKPYIPNELLKDHAIIQYNSNGMISENKGKYFQLVSANPSPAALEVLFNSKGWELSENYTTELYNLAPREIKNYRYCISFVKSNAVDRDIYNFETVYRNNHIEKSFRYNTSVNVDGNKKWEFDANVASGFIQHARQHIPDYDRVIMLSVELCRRLLPSLQSKIIDVGCATGSTLSALNSGECSNLVGVDSSQPMLDQVPKNIAELICSSEFPATHGPYGAVLCNWTLHFISDKLAYLQNIYNSIQSGGFLVLTDKTSDQGVELSLYHNFKRLQHVPEAEIEAKAKSVKDIMFINDVQWYFETLKRVGFDEIKIVNAAPCFTTFLAFKK